MKQIIAQLFYELEKQNDTVLVTLTAASGSAPRKAGTQMLVGREGRLTGTVGGGAVEGRSIALAQQLLRQRCSGSHHFPLHPGAPGDIGMICGGDVTAHFQFIPAGDPAWREVISQATRCMEKHMPGRLVLRESGGAPALLDMQGRVLCGELPEEADPLTLLVGSCVRQGGCLSLPLPVGQRALLFGAGHISQCLCPLLTTIDFRPVVFDCRPEFANTELFPEAEQVICGDFDRIADYLTVTPEDYIVVMTSGHGFDFAVQEQVLRGPFAYIGVIGSRRKTAAVNRRLREAGISDEAIARVHTPIGTDIRAVTPAEIAVSIAGEMICVRAERRGEEARACPMH